MQLLQTELGSILVNTGIGTIPKSAEDMGGFHRQANITSALLKSLKSHSLGPRNIKAVILTDLRFYSAWGCIRFDRAGNVVPVFPKARYIVQEEAVREAVSDNPRTLPVAGYIEKFRDGTLRLRPFDMTSLAAQTQRPLVFSR